MRRKRYKATDHFILKSLVNKQLEKYGVDYDYIISLPNCKVDGADWFSHYTLTNKEADEFMVWADNFLNETLVNYWNTKKKRNSIIFQFVAMWGLTVKD